MDYDENGKREELLCAKLSALKLYWPPSYQLFQNKWGK